MATRHSIFAAVVVCVVSGTRSLPAEDVTVPISVQAELTAKVAAYDKNFGPRAGSRARVLVVFRSGDVVSEKTAGQMMNALDKLPTIGGLPHDDERLAFTGRTQLAQSIRTKRAAIVYVSPGFDDGEITGIADALNGVDVLTVAALARYVPEGVVLGFDLVSGKPKLLVHLGQARRQNVAFKSDLLKLMKVYE